MKNVVFESGDAHTILRNKVSINRVWNDTRKNTVLAKDQLSFNYCCSFKGRWNGRYTKNNKIKCLSFNNYLFFRKILSNQIFNDEKSEYLSYFKILNSKELFTKIYISVSLETLRMNILEKTCP